MASYSEYLKWRGDISFSQVPLCVVDALLLSQLSYLSFQNILEEGYEFGKITIKDLSEQYWTIHTQKELDRHVSGALRTAGGILRELADTKRFSSLIVKNRISKLDQDVQEQFAAVEIELTARESFISYCGTDDSLIGWKEDFNMSFLSPIPAQEDALSYLERVMAHNTKKYFIGGHSKGGNLAVYAGVKCGESFGRRIQRIFNLDGPGFNKAFVEGEDYQDRKKLIETWVPESSVVGMLFEHEEAYKVVKSNKTPVVLQHEVTNWEVMGSGLITCKQVKKSSMKLAEGVRQFIGKLTPEELKLFCDSIYEVLKATKATSLADINEEKWKSATQIIKSYGSMNKETKDMLFNLIKAILTSKGENTIIERL